MRTVHLAGLDVNIEGRVLQRCAICGMKLVDSLNTLAPVKPDGSPPDPMPTWPVNTLVGQEPNGPNGTVWFQVGIERHEDGRGNKLPEGFCIDLVEQA